FERLIRYQSVLTNAVSEITLDRDKDQYRVRAAYPDRERMPLAHGRDLNISALLKMCSIAAGAPVRPDKVELVAEKDWHPEAYAELFGCPIRYGCDADVLWFDASAVDAQLPGAMPELLDATDRIVTAYMDSFDKDHVATQVRTLLIRLLPSGEADQEVVAAKLFRSASTLQRQLAAEDTTYREVLAETRESLAREFLASGEYSAADVAFMLGFADQSVFSRAFKRWTNTSPGEYRKSVQGNAESRRA
ncbi:MAG: helix-turn-helix domain-containing protein, partial [Woeseiaceae bacterium]|nr:helix-turn-helix domain-containing protein [Woeseiaceae bacterium]